MANAKAKTGKSTARKSNAKRSAAKMDAITLLTDDHARVKKLFRSFEKLKDKDDELALQDIVTTACSELQVHSKLEEELFYPAVRALADHELEEMLNEAKVEHGSVDELVHKLANQKLDDEMYKAHFTVVMEYVKHHVKEEEKEMFPKVRKLKRLDLKALGERMRARQEELMGEFIKEAGHAMEDSELADEALLIGAKKSKSPRIRAGR